MLLRLSAGTRLGLTCESGGASPTPASPTSPSAETPNSAPSTPAAEVTPAQVTAASLALFNPLVNAKLVCNVTLPQLAAASYPGGSNKLLAEFNSVVASNAALEGTQAVQSTLTNTAPAMVHAVVSTPR